MWLLFHSNAKTRVVKNGERFVDTCPDCHERATFTEVEIEENVGMFFVDLVGDRERAFRCGSCNATFDRKGDDDAPVAPPVKSAAELARDAKLVEAQRAALAEQKAALAEKKAVRIEDELAELKKRLGR